MYQAKSSVKNFSLYWEGGGRPLCENFFFQSEHVSSQIWCQNFFPLLGRGSPGKVTQNELKHILVLEFLRSDDFGAKGVGGEGGGGGPSVRYRCTTGHTDTRHSDQISRSTHRDGATKNRIFTYIYRTQEHH